MGFLPLVPLARDSALAAALASGARGRGRDFRHRLRPLAGTADPRSRSRWSPAPVGPGAQAPAAPCANGWPSPQRSRRAGPRSRARPGPSSAHA